MLTGNISAIRHPLPLIRATLKLGVRGAMASPMICMLDQHDMQHNWQYFRHPLRLFKSHASEESQYAALRPHLVERERERERDRENDQADMTDGDLTGPTPIRPFSLGGSVPVGYQLDTSLIPV